MPDPKLGGRYRLKVAAFGLASLAGFAAGGCQRAYAQQAPIAAAATNETNAGSAAVGESRFGYAAATSKNTMIATRLVGSDAVDAAYEFLSRQIELPRGDLDASLADAMELVRLETLRRIGDAAITTASLEELFDHTIEPSSRLAEKLVGRIASPSSSDPAAATPLPSASEARLMLDFAVERNRVELTRYLVAASAAAVGDELLRRKAAASVDFSRERLSSLREASTRRASELSTLRAADAMRWRNELYRLANETLLMSIDVATMQLDAAADEPATVRAASALLSDIEATSDVFAASGVAPPTLVALRARADAVLGRRDAAVEALSKAIDATAVPAIRRELEFALLEVLLTPHRDRELDDAATVIRELLGGGEVTAPLALGILKYQLARLEQDRGSATVADRGGTASLDRQALAAMLSRPPQRNDVIALRDVISTRFGDHWRWRSDALILRMMPRSSTADASGGRVDSSEYAFVDVQVTQDLLAGRLDAAVAALSAAEQQASRDGSETIAYEFAAKRSALLHSVFAKRAAEVTDGEQVVAAKLALAEQTCDTAELYAGVAAAADLHHLGVRTAIDAAAVANTEAANSLVISLCERHVGTFPADPRNASIASTAEAMYIRHGDFEGAVAFAGRWLEAVGDGEASNLDNMSLELVSEHRCALRMLQTAFDTANCINRRVESAAASTTDPTSASIDTMLLAQDAAVAAVAPVGPIVSPHLHLPEASIVPGNGAAVPDCVRKLRELLRPSASGTAAGGPMLPSPSVLDSYLQSLSLEEPQTRLGLLALLAVDWAELLHHLGSDGDAVMGLVEITDALRNQVQADAAEASPLMITLRTPTLELVQRLEALSVGYRGDWPAASVELLAIAEQNPSPETLLWLARSLTLAGADPGKPSAVLRSLRRGATASTACWWRLTADLAVASSAGQRNVAEVVSYLLATASEPPPNWKEHVFQRAEQLSKAGK